MKILLHFFDKMSNSTWNLGLKFWWWALETIIHRFYFERFEYKIFTRPNSYAYGDHETKNFRILHWISRHKFYLNSIENLKLTKQKSPIIQFCSVWFITQGFTKIDHSILNWPVFL
jgi:hypothetical protein